MLSPRSPQPPWVFVIRLWVEPGPGGGARRGYVEHLGTGTRRYFSEIADATEFIAAWDSIRLDAPAEP
jgi:hypothetical protein